MYKRRYGHKIAIQRHEIMKNGRRVKYLSATSKQYNKVRQIFEVGKTVKRNLMSYYE